MTTLFIADLHLKSTNKELTQNFINFMRGTAMHAQKLYVLGDLFDFWISDNDNSNFAKQICHEFLMLTNNGVKVYFIKGNRDFLLGNKFCEQAGIKLLDDVSTIVLYGQKAIILHGDLLCTDDLKYQKFRKIVNLGWLQTLFNAIPWVIKKALVNYIQKRIKKDKYIKPLNIMDVNQDAVISIAKKYQAQLIIHGHTHRPDIHKFNLLNEQNNHQECTRIVLGDWKPKIWYLEVTASGFKVYS